jgi:TctA family transporter
MMTNFGIGWETIPTFPPQLVYSQTLGFVPDSGNTLPSVIPGTDSLPVRFDGCELVRVVVFGSTYGIQYTIRWLYGLHFAQVSEWSFPMPAPGSSEMMSIVTKRIPLGRTN